MVAPCCHMNQTSSEQSASEPPRRLQPPRFESAQALSNSSEWLAYLKAVYGTDTEPTFPLDLAQFNFFYFNVLPRQWQRDLASRPILGSDARVDLRTGIAHRHFKKGVLSNNAVGRHRREWYILYGGLGGTGSGAATAWRYLHRDTLTGHANHSKVEVYHCSDKQSGRFWMYHARGSGIFYNVGRTFIARDALQLSALNLTHEELRRRGVESIQFTHTFEDGIYKYEVLDLPPSNGTASSGAGQHNGTLFRNASDKLMMRLGLRNSACPTSDNARYFTRGWQGERPCRCQDRLPRPARFYGLPCLNCGGLDAGALQSCVV